MSASKRERHPGPSGLPRVAEPRTAVVIGGGLAGCAAALTLADRGVSVVLVEREASLGGRLRGWSTELKTGETVQMDRGFHAFFRQYYNLRRLLKRIDPNGRRLVPTEDYPLFGPGGRSESFAGLPTNPIAALAALITRTETMDWRDALAVPGRLAGEMLAFGEERTYENFDEMSASEYLDALRFPTAARQMLFEVFAHSFFVPEAELSAARLIEMFHLYFTGNPDGLIFDVWNGPFASTLWAPMAALLEEKGCDLRLARSVTRLDRRTPGKSARNGAGKVTDTSENPEFPASSSAAGGAMVLLDDGSSLVADAVIIATEVGGLRAIVDASEALNHPEFTPAIDSLDVTAPFAVWRLWLDTPADEGRAPFAGTTGLGYLDNISLYERFQDEAAQWATSHGGSVVELHAYAVPEHVSEAALRADLWRQLVTVYPEFRRAQVLDERFAMDRDCPHFRTGAWKLRPTTKTPWPDITLAGDHVRLPFPSALMEAATSSGIAAANAHLERWGVAGEDLWSVPSRGMLAKVLPAPDPTDTRAVLPPRRPRRPWRLFVGRRPNGSPTPALRGPDWAQANPRRIDRAWQHASGLPTGGWFVVDATRNIGKSPKAYVIDEQELVLWRDSSGVHAAPAACPHMGASLAGAHVEECALVCPWHGLRLGAGGHGSWSHRPVFDDGVLTWVRLAEAGEALTPEPIIAPRPRRFLDAVVRMEADCAPEDIIRNRLDPWHGAHFHPYSFDELVVTDVTDAEMRLRVSYRIAGPVVMEVDATFHCPDRRTIVMTIVGGEGVGSVVETHATPISANRSAVIEATLATSERRGFQHALRLASLIRPGIRAAARRLWEDDLAYAERTALLRRAATTAPNPTRLDLASGS